MPEIKLENAGKSHDGELQEPFVSSGTSDDSSAVPYEADEMRHTVQHTAEDVSESNRASDEDQSPESTEQSVESSAGKETAEPNFRNVFVGECLGFAKACSEYIPEIRAPEKQRISKSYLFDLLNVCFSNMDDSHDVFSMPVYIAVKRTLVRCRRDGIYSDRLITAYEPFLDDASEFQETVIRESLKDCVGRRSIVFSNMDLLCLMPDVVDDFSYFFRNQLEVNGQRLFMIPRSIALAYAALVSSATSGVLLPERFLCLDYDGEEFMAIEIRREKSRKGYPVFVRIGRRPVEGKHPCYKTLAFSYMKEYQQKYNVPFTEKMKHDLLDTKLLQHMLLSKEKKPVILTDGATSVDVWIDDSIVEKLIDEIVKDAEAVQKSTSVPVLALCNFGQCKNKSIYSFEALEKGCKEIRKRSEKGETLWEEYLPRLQLAVHRDGTFDDLELIGEKDRKQQIVSAYIGKSVEMTIKNGTIVLAKGKPHYDLPLVREVYGSMNKEKLARFEPKEPLQEDTEVELRIYYTYGDVDSYRLEADCKDGTKIVSVWRDSELLENPAPSYTSKDESITKELCDRIYQGFHDFSKNVHSKSALRNSIFPGKNRLYSNYLRGLNERFWPFFPVKNYFRDSNYFQVKTQINELLHSGVFKTVADVMNGVLPTGHNLEAERYTPPKGDPTNAARVLRKNMTDLACLFGILYALKDEKGKRYEDVAAIVDAFRKNKSRTPMESWALLTAYVLRDDDQYGIWDGFTNALYTLDPNHPHVYSLLAISSVCYQTEGWVFEFYKGPNRKQDLDHLLANIYACLYEDEWKNPKKLPYNPKKIRDVLELLLCLCRLKAVDQDVLNCNSPETKVLVARLKKIDADIRELKENDKLQKEFNSRLGIELPYEYRRVNKVIYSLIQTLTGGGTVSLVGFKEDDAR